MPAMEPVGLDFLDTAPVVFTTDVDLPCGADVVWPYLVDNASWTEWFVECASCTGEPAVWTGAGQTRSISLKPLRVDEISVAVEPEHRWAMTLVKTNLPLAKRMLEMVELHDSSRNGEVRTRVQWTGALEPYWFTRPVMSLLEGKLAEAWGQSFENLFEFAQSRSN